LTYLSPVKAPCSLHEFHTDWLHQVTSFNVIERHALTVPFVLDRQAFDWTKEFWPLTLPSLGLSSLLQTALAALLFYTVEYLLHAIHPDLTTHRATIPRAYLEASDRAFRMRPLLAQRLQ